MRGLPIAFLAAALILSGCGGDDDDDSAASPDDQAIVEAAIAVLEERLEADGFEGAPDDDDDDDAFQFESEECRKFESALPDDADVDDAAEAESDEYTRGDLSTGGIEETVSARVAIPENTEDLDLVMELFRDERLAGCFEEAFRAGAAESGAEDGIEFDIDLNVEANAQDFGDEAYVLRMEGTFGAAGLIFPVEFGIHVVRAGDAAIFLMTSAVGEGPTIDNSALIELLVDELVRA